MIDKVNIASKLNNINGLWYPHVVGRVGESMVKLTKLKGEFVWHAHAREDEMFLVVHGEMVMKIRGQEDLTLTPGEFVIIPSGVEHCPTAMVETHVMLFEPATTVNTGEVVSEMTRRDLPSI